MPPTTTAPPDAPAGRHRAVFLRALETIGPEINAVRNDLIYQHAGRPRWRQAVSGVRVLMLELTLLFRPGRGSRPPAKDVVALLPHATGMGPGVLQAAQEELRSAGISVTVMRHPRLAADAWPGSAVLRLFSPLAVLKALATALPYLVHGDKAISRVLLYTLMVRAAWWRAACRRYLDGFRGVLLLVIDYDMTAAAALEVLVDRRSSVCIQHGLPTQDYFPVNARHHVVWAKSSEDVYRENGVTPRWLTRHTVYKGPPHPDQPTAPPRRICLISQTHTRTYGIDQRAAMIAFLDELRREMPEAEVKVKVLLHPFEVSSQPYAGIAGITLQEPPHAELDAARTARTGPALVVGFSSTALLDAAWAAHYVIGLDWQPCESLGAAVIGMPPLRVAGAAEVAAAYRRLQTDASFRRELAGAQGAWLDATFETATDADGQTPFQRLIRSILSNRRDG